jgi:hypothetical protein
MADSEAGSSQAVMLQLDIEGTNALAKVEQYLQDGRSFLEEQQQKAGLEATTNPSKREIQLIENYAVGKYTLNNTKGHSETLFTSARTDIRTHISAILQNKTEDDIATGGNQFKFSSGGVRSGNGI